MSELHQQVRTAILAADAVGFSKLGEMQVKSFVREFWGRVAALLKAAPAGQVLTATYSDAANASGNAATASDFALLRAAELTLQNGYDYFTVTQRGTESNGRYGGGSGPRIGVGIGGGNFGHHSGVSIGTDVGFNLGGGSGGGATSILEVRLGKGAKPSDPNAYDARSIESSLRRPPA